MRRKTLNLCESDIDEVERLEVVEAYNANQNLKRLDYVYRHENIRER